MRSKCIGRYIDADKDRQTGTHTQDKVHIYIFRYTDIQRKKSIYRPM